MLLSVEPVAAALPGRGFPRETVRVPVVSGTPSLFGGFGLPIAARLGLLSLGLP